MTYKKTEVVETKIEDEEIEAARVDLCFALFFGYKSHLTFSVSYRNFTETTLLTVILSLPGGLA